MRSRTKSGKIEVLRDKALVLTLETPFDYPGEWKLWVNPDLSEEDRLKALVRVFEQSTFSGIVPPVVNILEIGQLDQAAYDILTKYYECEIIKNKKVFWCTKRPTIKKQNYTEYSETLLKLMLVCDNPDLESIDLLIANGGATSEIKKIILDQSAFAGNIKSLKYFLNKYSFSPQELDVGLNRCNYTRPKIEVFSLLLTKYPNNCALNENLGYFTNKDFKALISLKQSYQQL